MKGVFKNRSVNRKNKKEFSNYRLNSVNFRIVIPNLTEYSEVSPDKLDYLKQDILHKLKNHPSNFKRSEFQRGLKYYNIAIEHHVNGVPHLDILLIYDKSQQFAFGHYDYLYKHGNVTTYRRLNQAILEYGKKQDKFSVTNMPRDFSEVVQVQCFKQNPYRSLELEMLKDPVNFCLEQYALQHDLYQYIPNWSSVKTKLKDAQIAAANLMLRTKSGFRYIDRTLIQQSLTLSELKLYDSWKGYSRIVHYLNQIITYKGNRQQKSLNLLITGAPNCGKSALVWQRNPPPSRCSIFQHCSVYPIGMSQWFPKYQSDVYHCIYWNQMKLTTYSYDTILKILDGSPLDLPNKGSVSRKVDNPLIIMTSNMTLQQMIKQKFGNNPDYLRMSRENLKVRIENVVVPEGLDLFILQKLLKLKI